MKTSFLLKNIKIYKWQISVPVLLWFTISIVAAIAEISRGASSINNFLIFRGTFWHTIHQQNLFAQYPNEYIDSNHYGPLFSILIAPFAVLPLYIGCFLWCIANIAILFYAVRKLPVSFTAQQIILLIGTLELATSIHNVQFNPMLTGWIILSYTFIKNKQECWATLFIIAGFLIKIYGIAGIVFFLFSENKIKFIAYFIMWFIILFCLPILLSSTHFLIQSYQDWFNSLLEKNSANITIQAQGNMQDISAMGLIRRPFKLSNFKDIYMLAPAAALIALPALRFKQYKHTAYQLTYLAVALISVVVFSTGAESPTYILAVLGVAIWYVLQDTKNKKWVHILLVLVLIITSLSSTDLFPRYLYKVFILPYALKALPCFLVWLIAVYQLFRKDFSKITTHY